MPQLMTVGAIAMYCSKSVLLSGMPTRRSSDMTSRKTAVTAPEAFFFVGEGLDQALGECVPALRDAEGEVGEDEGVEAVRVHLDELDPVEQADPAQDAGDPAVPDPTDVVKPDVELPLALAPEGLAAAARRRRSARARAPARRWWRGRPRQSGRSARSR